MVWMLWINGKPIACSFVIVINSFMVISPIGIVSGVMREMIPVVVDEFYWCWACCIFNIIASSKGGV